MPPWHCPCPYLCPYPSSFCIQTSILTLAKILPFFLSASLSNLSDSYPHSFPLLLIFLFLPISASLFTPPFPASSYVCLSLSLSSSLAFSLPLFLSLSLLLSLFWLSLSPFSSVVFVFSIFSLIVHLSSFCFVFPVATCLSLSSSSALLYNLMFLSAFILASFFFSSLSLILIIILSLKALRNLQEH
jgi:hypothetical protein